MNRKIKTTAFIKNKINCNIISVLAVAFESINASLLNKIINLFKKKIEIFEQFNWRFSCDNLPHVLQSTWIWPFS